MSQSSPIKVAVCGATGKMGREVVKTILQDPELELVGAVDKMQVGENASRIAHVDSNSTVQITDNLGFMLAKAHPQVCVDFTHPETVLTNALAIIQAGCRPVIGTTGLSTQGLEKIDAALKNEGLGGMVVPNFAIGAVLMMKFAQEASKYFGHGEIIELHHNKKADAPSGTAIKTAELMAQNQPHFGVGNASEKETYPGARGGTGPGNLHIHSVRLPGLVAHQEVLFGSPGQLLTIRHDSLDRTCFMPGVALAVKKVMELTGLVYGLEHIL